MKNLVILSGILFLLPAVVVSRQPVIWWTPEEAAELRTHMESHPLGQAQLEKTLSQTTHKRGGQPTLVDLFRYAVLEDKAAGQRQKAELLKMIGRKPEPLTWNVDPKTLKWNEGMPSSGDRHMRDDQSENVWRYDLLYHELTPEQREGIETAFRTYIQFHLDGAPPKHPHFSYSRTGWLPNMHWPRPMGTHLMAVALGEEDLIKAMFEGEGGFKWYLDTYMADGFYMEEFGKYYSTVHSLQLWCEGLEDLGLGQYGYGYTSPSGNSMRKYLQMNLRLGYPKTTIPGGMDQIRKVSMGDARGAGHGVMGVFEHAVVNGFLANGQGGEEYWRFSHMNGPYPKARDTIWYELAVQRWPEDGYGFLLHQMRRPGDPQYVPTLFHGLKPLSEEQIQPPAVESYLTRERGFAFLRMEESPEYWDSPRPAVSQQFGMYYVHYVHDCFSLLGYQAFNRPIYLNAWGGSGKGYAGGHPWKDSTRGHMGIVVDNRKPRPIDRGERGLETHTNIRFASTPDYKVSGARAKGLWAGVDLERVLVLTDDYLLDVTRVVADKERQIDWMVHGPGMLVDSTAWTPSDELKGGLLYLPPGSEPTGKTIDDLRNLQKREESGTWQTTFLQSLHPSVEMAKSKLGPDWYNRGVGVRLTMAGEEGTLVYTGEPPVKIRKGKAQISEAGGFSLMVRRQTATTTFAALHVPFEGGVEKAPEAELETLSDESGVIVFRVRVGEQEDIIALALGDAYGSQQKMKISVKSPDTSNTLSETFEGQRVHRGVGTFDRM